MKSNLTRLILLPLVALALVSIATLFAPPSSTFAYDPSEDAVILDDGSVSVPTFDPNNPCDQLWSIQQAQQKLILRAQVSQTNVIRGGEPTEDIAALQMQARTLALVLPEVRLTAMNGGCY